MQRNHIINYLVVKVTHLNISPNHPVSSIRFGSL